MRVGEMRVRGMCGRWRCQSLGRGQGIIHLEHATDDVDHGQDDHHNHECLDEVADKGLGHGGAGGRHPDSRYLRLRRMRMGMSNAVASEHFALLY